MSNSNAAKEKPAGQEELRMLEWTTLRRLSEARTLLAIVAMLAVKMDLPESTSGPISAVLTPYAVYGAVILLLATSARAAAGVRFAYWVDAAIYLAVVAMSGGVASNYWVFLLFPVLVASLQSGYRQGALFAVGCAVIVVAMGPADVWHGFSAASTKAVLWSVAPLPMIGMVIARWGHSEFTLIRRLALSKNLNSLSSPSHTLQHTISALAEMLRTYYRADVCLIIVNDPPSPNPLSYEARRETTYQPTAAESNSETRLRSLLALPSGSGIAYCRRRYFWQRTVAGAYEMVKLQPLVYDRHEGDRLGNLLGTDSFLSLPIGRGHRVLGRLYLGSRRYRYGRSDLQFLQHMVSPAALILENIQLRDRLTSEVATQERQKISRDLHDGTIQPYIGLKLGLEALRRKVSADSSVAAEINELSQMATNGIAELRRYVAGLRSSPESALGEESLAVGVRRQAEKFSEYYGVDVQVTAERDVPVNPHLFNEVMLIVREGLSNIRRHTPARQATIALHNLESRLILEFLNDGATSGPGAVGFFPRSIAERARDLGGCVNVEQSKTGHTTVAVEIPL